MTSESETKILTPPKKNASKVTITSILGEIADFKGWEMIFRVLIYAFVAWGAYSLYLVYLFHHDPAFANVEKFSIYDFKVTIFPTLFFFGYKRVCLTLFYPFMKRTLDASKFPTEEERDTRAIKNSIWLSGIIYYIFTSCLSYFLFNDSFFFPSLLGGSNQCPDIYKYSPVFPHVPYATLFYQMQFGWHFHTLIDHVVYKWKEPKFWEMFLHHCVAVFLIFFSYLSNQVAVGILVLTTHDPSDIGLYGSRLYNDRTFKNSKVLYVIYAYFMLSWMYLRLFVFPKCIVGAGFEAFFALPQGELMYGVYLYLLFMLSALVLLHLYWFTFIVRIVIGLLFKQADANIYDKSRKSL